MSLSKEERERIKRDYPKGCNTIELLDALEAAEARCRIAVTQRDSICASAAASVEGIDFKESHQRDNCTPDELRQKLLGLALKLEAVEADRDDCLRKYGELYEERGRIVSAEAERDELDVALSDEQAAHQETLMLWKNAQTVLDGLRKQLPEGMENCIILFRECEKGHGRLTATNWIDHGCPTCERDRLREALRPFAGLVVRINPSWPDGWGIPHRNDILIGDCRRARAALDASS